MTDERSQAYARLVAEPSRRIDAGELVRGERIDVEDERFEVEGFDPFGADGRRVHVRTPRGQRLTVRVPAG